MDSIFILLQLQGLKVFLPSLCYTSLQFITPWFILYNTSEVRFFRIFSANNLSIF
jgi:hypothetical protein